jgi:hypothetical protein
VINKKTADDGAPMLSRAEEEGSEDRTAVNANMEMLLSPCAAHLEASRREAIRIIPPEPPG